MWKMNQLVSRARIQSLNDFWNMSLFPYQLDQDSEYYVLPNLAGANLDRTQISLYTAASIGGYSLSLCIKYDLYSVYGEWEELGTY